MPSKVKITIRRAKNLPIMDRKTKLTDAYVEVRHGQKFSEKTPLQAHTLNPVWNKTIAFKVHEDRMLITDPVEIKVFDKDVVSDDIIGVVYLDLSTLFYPRPQPPLSSNSLSSPRPHMMPTSPQSAGVRTISSDKKLNKESQSQPNSGGASLSSSTSISVPNSSKKVGIFTPPKLSGSLLLRNVRKDGSGPSSVEETSCCSDLDDTDAGAVSTSGSGSGSSIEDDSAKISGWFPIYDTLKGVQGEINLSVEVKMIKNVDAMAESTVGVQFFTSSTPPYIERVAGLVGACKIAEDPEYQWTDTFRFSRTSNEARQVLMYKLAGKLREEISAQVRALKCNAVIGYRQCIEIEGTMGLVARGYGTAAVVIPYAEPHDSSNALSQDQNDFLCSPPFQPADMCGSSAAGLTLSAPLNFSPPGMSLNSSSLNPLSGTLQQQQQQQQQIQQSQLVQSVSSQSLNQTQQQQQAQIQKIPILTVTNLEPDAIQHIGGVVISRMVRLMKKTDSANSKIRSKWWDEIRNEVRRHANSLGCTHVIGYIEEVAAQDFEELTVMSGVGTAVTISPAYAKKYSSPIINAGFNYRPSDTRNPCRACHVPYMRTSKLPFQTQLTRCCICGRKYVPDMILSTSEIPQGVAVVGSGEFIQARIVLPRKHGVGKKAANSISSNLPFLEYELHRQLTIKLGIMGMNAVFGLNYELEVGMNSLIGVATGTAVYLRALPPPNLSFKKEDDPLRKAYEVNNEKYKALIREDMYSQKHMTQKSISSLSNSSITPKRTTKSISVGLPRTNSAQKITLHSNLLSKPSIVVPQASSSDNDEIDDNDDDDDECGVITITSTESDDTEPKKKRGKANKKKKKSLSSSTDKHKKKKKSKAEKHKKSKHKKDSDQGGQSHDAGSNSSSSNSSDSSSDSDSSPSGDDDDDNRTSSGGRGSTNEGVNSYEFSDTDDGSKVFESPDINATAGGLDVDYPSSSPEIDAEVPVYINALKQPYVLSLPELIENDSGMHDDRYVPRNVHLCTTETLPGDWVLGKDSKLIVLARRTHWRSHFSMRSLELERTLDDMVSSAVFNSCRDATPYCISALKVRIDMVESRDAQVVLTAVCTPLAAADPKLSSSGSCGTHVFQLDDALPSANSISASLRSGSTVNSSSHEHHHQQQQNPQGVIITALTSLPHKVITRHLGFVDMHIVRESFSLRNELGKEGFTTDIFVDMFSILRARVSAMNGNALIGFNMNIFHFKSSTQKDQGYCLVSLTGDAVKYKDV